MKRALFITTSTDAIPGTAHATGLWLSGLTHPYHELMARGFDLDVASPLGGRIPIDPFSDPRHDRSIGKDDIVSAGFLASPHHAGKLDETLRLGDIADPLVYRAIILCGGNGAMFDLRGHADVTRLLRAAWDSGRIVAAISHGVAGLVEAEDATGKPLFKGLAATAPTAEERLIAEQLIGKPYYPLCFEEALARRKGLRFVKATPYAHHVVVSAASAGRKKKPAATGVLVTAQNHPSSVAFAKRVGELVDRLPHAPPPRSRRVDPQYEPRKGLLGAINQFFHDDYEELVRLHKLALEREGSPVIILTGSELILRRAGKRLAMTFIPPLYDRFKAIGHMVFGLYLSLLVREPNGLSETELVRLEQQHLLINAMLANLDHEGFPDDTLSTQRALLVASAGLLSQVRRARSVDLPALRRFAHEMGLLMRENNVRAQRLHLDALHAQMSAWLGDMTPLERERLHVVVCGSHQSRYLEIASLYFQRLFGEDAGIGAHKEDKVIFAESTFEEANALDLVARHAIDQDAGQAFFADRFKMQRDLLSDGAAAYVETLLG